MESFTVILFTVRLSQYLNFLFQRITIISIQPAQIILLVHRLRLQVSFPMSCNKRYLSRMRLHLSGTALPSHLMQGYPYPPNLHTLSIHILSAQKCGEFFKLNVNFFRISIAIYDISFCICHYPRVINNYQFFFSISVYILHHKLGAFINRQFCRCSVRQSTII